MIREFSAGGVVVCDKGGQPFVAVVRVRGETLALPKGHPFGDESAAEAARREVREETGLDAEVVDQLGDVKYWYVRGGKRVAKVVTFFLFRYRSGNVADHDHEVEEALWIPLDEAPERLAYRSEKEIAQTALSRVASGK
jgi:8-oxo-dGTP pyrophosphatase MutT (NUDIX family)